MVGEQFSYFGAAAHEVNLGAKFETGMPKSLFDMRIAGSGIWFDVSKDGRFLIPIEIQQSARAPMTVVVNWPSAMKRP
jgi:hypothetical protein